MRRPGFAPILVTLLLTWAGPAVAASCEESLALISIEGAPAGWPYNGAHYTHLHLRPPARANAPDHQQQLLELARAAEKRSVQLATPAIARVERWIIDSRGPHGPWRMLERTTFEANGVVVEILDTKLEWNPPEEMLRRLDLKGLSYESWLSNDDGDYSQNRFRLAEAAANELSDVYRAKQVALIDEILEFIWPLYAERRGWNASFLRSLKIKAYQSMDFTRYISIREKTLDGSRGPLLATLGLIRAAYRKLTGFNAKTGQWEERYFDVDSDSKVEPNVDFTGPLRVGTNGQTRGLSMEMYLSSEHILGDTDYFLPRPSVPIDIRGLSQLNKHDAEALRSWSWDLSKPVYLSTGRIFEPTKFGVAKNLASRGIAYSQVLAEMFRSVFTGADRNDFMNMQGQALYTYNDSKGVALYRRMGFSAMGPEWSKHKDDVDWVALMMSPSTLVNTLGSRSFLEARGADNLSGGLMNALRELMDHNYRSDSL